MKYLKDIKHDKPPDAFTKIEQLYCKYEQRKLMKKRTIKELLKFDIFKTPDEYEIQYKIDRNEKGKNY